MPLGIQRLNARHQPPTPHILFLKPLPGPSAAHAESFLARIAALMHPILRTHRLSVTALEEFPANREFVGRNFNAGECVQLVLRGGSGGGGGWLPFRAVALVMVHELAHNEHMHHGRAFWRVRNEMAAQLRGLWARGYTGEGVWGRGRALEDGEWMAGASGNEDALPTQVCGGVYRSRRRGRKRRADELSWREREERRVRRKFGAGGVALGDDEARRRAIEKGGWGKGKPRVAGSKRGRELRAAAALARFGEQKEEAVKKEEEVKIEEDDDDHGSTTDGEDDAGPDAENPDGSQMVDAKGQAMVKVCEEEDAGDVHVKEEMDEIMDLQKIPQASSIQPDASHRARNGSVKEETDDTKDLQSTPPESPEQHGDQTKAPIRQATDQEDERVSTAAGLRMSKDQDIAASMKKAARRPNQAPSSCPVCSLENEPSAWICGACSHVLKPQLAPGHWRCTSSSCAGSSYVNAGDCGVCGVCGSRKPV